MKVKAKKARRLKTKKLQTLIPLLLMVAVGVGFTLNYGTGSLSSLGWRDISIICPLGALSSMLAAKTVIPRAAYAIVFALVFILLFGRAFCSWACPVPVVAKLRDAFRKKEDISKEQEERKQGKPASESYGTRRPRVDSRHLVLLAALLSATIFGFPVFCLICPVGLTFATIFLLIMLFGHGTLNWSVVVVPLVLLVEVVFFKRWCGKICPLGALMSLVAKANVTFRPTIDANKCMETSEGTTCGLCARSCGEGIDLRDPSTSAARSECTRCRTCVEGCPAHAIKMPPLNRPGARARRKHAA